ncbi:hypothetical protein CONCODRAFT_124352 [Conidiobolus coronatus NRRL 28638]|uniref:Uncharacterized protein n=1 Tax=Conidiobolus coronatus (strain ATCC 28846 / CBS 209.66 / NRRL 28638) TaxID=796925 RepID=A0A137NVD0_CONC2|nr:hypothetical protein CONCODRAFT_124352 [Conidiobolus coronatus NRRL 28638]|eukprot:KXN66760.1 hypothetical protein CONCODRAFT_124352 [Conidiobolus coronatus NRRL 28638]
MDISNNYKDLKLVISGEFRSVKIVSDKLIIVDGHYSTGSTFQLEIRDNINCLMYNGQGLRLKPDNTISIDDDYGIFYPLITLDAISPDGEGYYLGYKDGYLDSSFAKCDKESAIQVQFIWPNLISSAYLAKYNKLFDIQAQFPDKSVSVDGISLLSNNLSFSMILDYSLIKHPFSYGDDNLLFWDCDYSCNLQFKFKYINGSIVIYSPSVGYLESRFIKDFNSEVCCFNSKLPSNPITLCQTSTPGVYKLCCGDKFVNTRYRASWMSNSLEKDKDKASVFQFVLTEESYKHKNSIDN